MSWWNKNPKGEDVNIEKIRERLLDYSKASQNGSFNFDNWVTPREVDNLLSEIERLRKVENDLRIGLGQRFTKNKALKAELCSLARTYKETAECIDSKFKCDFTTADCEKCPCEIAIENGFIFEGIPT